MSVQRIDQGMATAAAELLPEHVDKELRTRCRHLRVMLNTAGLAATYAYLAAKSGSQTSLERAYRDVAESMRERLEDAGLLAGGRRMSHRQVLAELGAMSPARYARAGLEAATLAGWLARLADALYEPESRDGDDPADGAAATGRAGEQEPRR
ncbi:MAG TPA: type III-B CRISPR module-associated protein Cmr5 [Streptosporangiaceae bacterium]